MSPRARAVVVPVVVALVLAVAGDARASTSSDTRLARRGVVVASDLPASWTSSGTARSARAAESTAADDIPDCKADTAFETKVAKAPNVVSPHFSTSGASFSNRSAVLSSTKAAKQAMGELRDASVPSCLEQLTREVLQDQLAPKSSAAASVSNLTVTIQPATVFSSALADEIVGYSGSAQAEMSDGTSQQWLLESFAVRVGRVIDAYNLTRAPGADVSDAADSAAAASLARTATALHASR